MTTKAADDFEAIRRRLEELAAEKSLALTGSTLEEKAEAPKGFDADGMYMWPTLQSSAHPGWPYAGTAHEWRGFVNQK